MDQAKEPSPKSAPFPGAGTLPRRCIWPSLFVCLHLSAVLWGGWRAVLCCLLHLPFSHLPVLFQAIAGHAGTHHSPTAAYSPRFGSHYSLLMDIWVVSLGLMETGGAVAKSRGCGIIRTWIRMLGCVTSGEFLSLSGPWVPI